MKKLILFLGLLASGASTFASAETLKYKYGNFGEVTLVNAQKNPSRLVMLAAGQDLAAGLEKAKELADDNTVIAVFNTPKLLQAIGAGKSKCLYPAGDLELLSKFIQAKLKFPHYDVPRLVGFEEGASLAYVALAQAPTNTFSASFSFGYNSKVKAKKIFCKGYGLPSKLLPSGDVELKSSTRELKTWYPLAVGEKWAAQVRKLSSDLAVGSPAKNIDIAELSELPLVELTPDKVKSDYFVIFLSGDGGWAGFDRELSNEFVEEGAPVVGFNSLDYFWSPKSAEIGAKDLEKIIRAYQNKWKMKKTVIVGYSFGADVAPFFVSRLPADLLKTIPQVALLSPGKVAQFEFRFSDWIVDPDEGQPIAPEVKKLKGKVVLKCIYGEEETDALCASVGPSLMQIKKLPGGHDFDGDSKSLYDIIK